MPANLTPDYKAAEAKYRQARDPRERLELLREMLRLIPKHKGTDHLQAGIKSRIKELTDALTGPRKGAARGGPPTAFRPEGAAQIALLGPPNTGKSTLHVTMTGSHSATGQFPFTTQYPTPGMASYRDIAFQLIDLPPLSPEHPIPWIGNTLQSADGCFLVVDLNHPDCIDEVIALIEILRSRRVILTGTWPTDGDPIGDPDDPFTLYLPTVLVANKADPAKDVTADLEVFEDLTGLRLPFLAVSAETGTGTEALCAFLFERLGIVRVYTKVPGKPPDMDRPYTVRHGSTVEEVAMLVHREMAAEFRHARIWGSESYDGQQVGRDHEVVDGDVVEIHT